ncbi:hypothetical protein MTYM_00463 [Methylococcales bacterium]|nr:hypothetical protein MTYM_00463 [Methylococcales bacterium]
MLLTFSLVAALLPEASDGASCSTGGVFIAFQQPRHWKMPVAGDKATRHCRRKLAMKIEMPIGSYWRFGGGEPRQAQIREKSSWAES